MAQIKAEALTMLTERLREFDNQIKQRPETKILVYFALILSLAVIPYVIVVFKMRSLEGHPIIEDCVLEAIFAAAAVGAVFLMRYTPGALPLEAYGFRLPGIVTQTATGAAIGLALMSAIMNVLRITGNFRIDRMNHNFAPLDPLMLFLCVAIFEETIFRGFIFTTIEQKWGSFVGLTTTSLLFGLSHMVDGVPGIGFGRHLMAALFIGMEAGVLFNAAFMLTRSLWLGIGIHWAWNFFEGPFYGANVSGMIPSVPLYQSRLSGSPLLTGGLFGPEAGIVCLITGMFAGLLVLLLAVRAGQWRPNPEIINE